MREGVAGRERERANGQDEKIKRDRNGASERRTYSMRSLIGGC